MSSNRGIEVRFTFPAGLHVTEHLKSFTSARARNLEIMRLAENALLTQKGVTLAPPVERDPVAEEVDRGSPTHTEVQEVEQDREKTSESALSTMNLMSIGD